MQVVQIGDPIFNWYKWSLPGVKFVIDASTTTPAKFEIQMAPYGGQICNQVVLLKSIWIILAERFIKVIDSIPWVRCSPGKKIAINCIFKEIWLNGSAIIVGKKRDHGILDPMIFSGKIRKNRINSEKYCVS